MEINNYVVEGLVDIGASMSVMAAAVVRELGIMHLVTSSETYKTHKESSLKPSVELTKYQWRLEECSAL
jgi:predicted aspartyl protease